MNRWVMEAGALLLIGAVVGCWHYRATILAVVNPPASAARPMENPDVLYTWVDKEGITHYSQASGKGERVEFDGAGITPMAPIEGKLLDSLDAAGSADQPKGSAALHDMRRQLQENQIKIQEGREAAMGL